MVETYIYNIQPAFVASAPSNLAFLEASINADNVITTALDSSLTIVSTTIEIDFVSELSFDESFYLDILVSHIINSTTPDIEEKSNNLTATSIPTANDDARRNYDVDSDWINTSTNKVYICVDNTTGAAIWRDSTIISATELPDFDTEVSNNPDVSNNTNYIDATTIDNALLSGGASWDTGLTFNVTQCSYLIGGVPYTSLIGSTTLSAADPTNDRIDLIVVDTAGNIVNITGTPAPTPITPEYDTDTQIVVTTVRVNAAQTEPDGITVEDIYLDNAGSGSGEWDTTENTSNARININSTNDPYSGTKSIEFTSAQDGDSVTFTETAAFNISTYSLLEFQVKSKATWPSTKKLQLAFYNGAVRESDWYDLDEGEIGLDTSNTTTHQNISIPISLILFSSQTVDSLVIKVKGTGANIGLYIDHVRLQSGIDQPSVNNNISGHISNFNNPHQVTKTQVGLGNVENILSNYNATTAPTVSDDNTAGYQVGSEWIDITNDRAYTLVDASTGAAIWVETTSGSNASYACLFETNPSGTTITITTSGTYVQWITGSVGLSSGTDLLQADAGTDRLTVGTSGAGEYLLNIYGSMSTMTNNTIVTMAAFKNGSIMNTSKVQFETSSGNATFNLSAHTLANLGVSDYIDLRFTTDRNNEDITVMYINVNAIRIGGSSGTGGGSGETNTGVNVGTAGVGVFKQKSGATLEFRNINVASNKLSVTNDTGDNEIDLDVVESNVVIGNLSGAPTGDVVGTTDIQTLTNKTFGDDVNINSTTQSNDTTSGALIIDGGVGIAKNLNVGGDINGITNTEFGYLDGVTSNIQTQIDGKAASSHVHDASDITTGTLPVIRGGTGAATHTSGNFLVGAGTSAVTSAKVAPSGTVVGTTDTQTLTNKTMGDNLNLNNNKIINLITPTGDSDAANKSYVDSVASGLDVKNSVIATTIVDLDSNTSISGTITYNNTGGTSGRGQITATLTTTDTFTIDGVTFSATEDGSRILLKDQSTGAQNGIWTTTVSGTSLTLDRATDFDSDSEVTSGAFTFIEQGTVHADRGFVLTTEDPIVIGGASGTSLTFNQFSGTGQITAGTGLTKSGAVINANGSTTIIANADDLEVNSSATANQILLSSGTTGVASTFGSLPLGDSNAVSGTLVVSNGGTGATTHTSGNFLIGAGTSAVTSAKTAPSGDVVGTTDSQTLTNKTIDADNNTITNIDNGEIKAGAAIDATKIANGTVSNTEFQYINSVTSNVQTQLNSKASTSHTHDTSDITSGTLPIARGGTGAASYSAGSRIVATNTGNTALETTTIDPDDLVTTSGDQTLGGDVTISSTTVSSNNTSGALVVSGGAGIGGDVNVGGDVTIDGTLDTNLTAGVVKSDANGVLSSETTNTGFNLALGTTAGTVAEGNHVHDTSDITTGTLPVVRGGTGATTHTSGNFLIGAGTSAVTSAKTAPSGDVVGTTDSQTLTNKTIDADNNTITNIDNGEIKAGAAIDATKIANGTVTNTEFQYINSVTSNVQTQLNSKASTSHVHDTSDITSGTLPIARGGTGAASYSAGSRIVATNSGNTALETTTIDPDDLVTTSGDQTLGGDVTISSTTVSNNNTSGALVVSGGVGISGDVNVAGDVYATNFFGDGSNLTGIDHGGLDGLADDDHTQYALLAGRSGGQTLIGGTAASDDLTLTSTSNATKGDINIGGVKVDSSNNLTGVVNEELSGYMQLADVSAPANPSNGEGRLYKKTGDDGIYWKPDSGGSEVDLTMTGVGGEANTASSVGGTGIFKQKSGVDLQFKGLTATSTKIGLTANTNDVGIDVNEANIVIGNLSGAPTGAVVGTTDSQTLTNKTFGDIVNINDTTQSNDTTSGALIVDGGVGIAKNLNVGGILDVNNNKIVNVATPTADTDAANKLYVDDQIGVDNDNLFSFQNSTVGNADHIHIRATIGTNATDPYNLNIDITDETQFVVTHEDFTYRQAVVISSDSGTLDKTIFGVSSSNDSGSSWEPGLVVTQERYVGISKSAPTEALDVNGNIAVSGTVDGRDVAADGTAQDNHIAATSGIHGVTGNVVGTSDSQTLTNKTMGDNLNLNNNKITNLATPTGDSDAANKSYVDGVASGLDVKNSVVATTSVDLDSNASISGTITYNNTGGTSGRGQITATLTTTDTFTIDGVTFSATEDGSRILLKDQSTGAQNGIWTTTISGTSLTLDRATDFDGDAEVTSGAFTFIEQGTVHADCGFVLTTEDPITIGGASGTSLTFNQFSGTGQITAGTGLTKSGAVINANGSTTIIANADDLEVNSSATANQILLSSGTSGVASTFGALPLGDSNAVSGTLVVSNGGTGATTHTSGNFLIGAGTSAVTSAKTAPSGDVVGTTDSQTLTNKTIDADNNTITNIDNGEIKAGAAIDATKIANGTVTNTEFQYINSVTSNVQTQLNSKASTSHVHDTSDITSGTLPIARGGTGAASYSAGSRIVATNTGNTALETTTIDPDDLVTTSGDQTLGGDVTISSTTVSSNNTSGALVVSGGAGISGDVNVGGDVTIDGTLDTNLTAGVVKSDANGVLSSETTNTGFNLALGTTAGTVAEGNHVHDASDITTGTIPVVRGGTGATTHTSGNFLIGAGTSAVTSAKAAPSGDVVGTTDSQTLTNKTINADNNTITNIDNGEIKAGAAIDATKIANGTVTNTEFQYINSVTSNIQTQLNSKASTSHTHDWDDATGTADVVPFNTGAGDPVYGEGKVFYDVGEHTLAVYNDQSAVTHQLGQEGYIRVYNNSGSAIVDGKPVYISGTEGVEDRPTIALARSDVKSTSEVIGVTTMTINNNSFGYITYWGLVNDLDTSSFVSGDTLYLDETTAGSYRTTSPPQGNYDIQIGFVIKSHATTGRILVSMNQNLATQAGESSEVVIDVIKQSVGTISVGKVVYVAGYDTGKNAPQVELADASSSSTMPAFGIMRDSCTNTTTGKLIIIGQLLNQNTSSYSSGDALYVSETTGELTNVKPTGTALVQKIGIVTRSHASMGVIEVFGAGRSNDLPNLPNSNFWLGNGSGAPTESTVNDLTVDASPDGAADYVMTWDANASVHKKVLLNNLPAVGGGETNTASSAGGTSLYKTKTGVDLIFKGLTATSTKIGLTSNTNDVGIDVNEGNIDINNLLNAGDFINVNDNQTLTGDTIFSSTTVSSNNTSGALVVSGGVGIGGDVNVGGDVYATNFFGDGSNLTGIDHGTLSGLADDDHTQYALLAGRSGGQTLIGGSASGEDLTLTSTSNATKGNVICTDRFLNVDGTTALPSYSFSSDPDTGMYRETNGDIAFSNGGTCILEVGIDNRVFISNEVPNYETLVTSNQVLTNKKYVDDKTWSATDITSGTLPVARGGTGAVTHTSGNFLVGAGTSAVTSAKVAPSGSVVGTTDSQTLTNKTLTTPVISTISNTGTLTLPTSTDTLVGKATTDILTNKTFNVDGTGNSLTNIANANIKTGATIDATKIADGTVTSTEFQYLNSVTSNVQTQLNGKSATGHAHAASDITSGTFVDARIAASNVTQHEGSLTIGNLTGAPSGAVVGVSDAQTLTNKTLTDSTTYLQDDVDNTKKVQFQLSGITTATTRTITVPDASFTIEQTGHAHAASDITSGTFVNARISLGNITQHEDSITIGNLSGAPTGAVVGISDAQTLTNKTVDADNNTITNIANAGIKAAAAIDATKIADGTVTSTEFQYLNSVTSNVQTQLNGKSATGHAHAASDITSGTFVDARIAASNVTQHEGSLTIGNLTGAPTGAVVGISDVQTLTNKTMTATTNNVTAKGLHSATTTVSVSAATAPTSGQVLTATSGTAATWQTPSGGGSLTYENVTATTTTTTTSGTYTLLNSMTNTPASGTYLVTFSASGEHTATSVLANYAIYSGGTISSVSERNFKNGGGQTTGINRAMHSQAVVTVNGSQAIEVRWHNGSNGTFTCNERSMVLIKL